MGLLDSKEYFKAFQKILHRYLFTQVFLSFFGQPLVKLNWCGTQAAVISKIATKCPVSQLPEEHPPFSELGFILPDLELILYEQPYGIC